MTTRPGEGLDVPTTLNLCRRLRCPALVVQGRTTESRDALGRALADAIGDELSELEGAGGHGLGNRPDS